jgi:hypothetical protein
MNIRKIIRVNIAIIQSKSSDLAASEMEMLLNLIYGGHMAEGRVK